MNKVRVGILGGGFSANLHVKAYKKCPQVDVIGVAAAPKNIDELKKFCQKYSIPEYYTDYRKLLNRSSIDLVSICVPNYLHRDVAIAAAQAGKQIVCEKPLSINLKQANEMVEACERNKVKLMYAENLIFAPALIKVKELCRQGAIGNILYIKAIENHSGSHSVYTQKLEFCGGGAMINVGVHPIGIVRWLKGKEIVEVVGKVSKGGGENLLHIETDGEDWGCGILTFADGTLAIVEGNYITLGGMDDRIEIYGTKGNIKVDLTHGSPISVYSSKGYDYVIEKADTAIGWTKPAVEEEYSLGYENEIAYFVDCVRRDRKVMQGTRGKDGLAALEVVTAIYRSAKEGKSIKLSPGEFWKSYS